LLVPVEYKGTSVTFHVPQLDIPLLPGEVNVFLEGSFTGNAAISYIPPGEDFDISSGIAENVKVKRELIKKFMDKTLIAAIPSSKITKKYEYKIMVENFQDTESLCYIFESVPVSEDDRIKVNIDKISKEPQLKDWNNKDRVWMWEFKLKPEGEYEIGNIYTILYPRDMQIIGLP
ncbi:MAG: DUF4139 domain-containing protein, partial [Atribacterota bacterium]